MTTKRERKMEQLFDATVDELIDRIQNGDAKPADLAVARGILSDNDITAAPKNKRLGVLRTLSPDDLPFEDGAAC